MGSSGKQLLSRLEWRLFSLALVCRLLFVVWLNLAPAEWRPGFAVITPDSKSYLTLAKHVMAGEGYHFGGNPIEPTRIPPLFSFWLALIGHISLNPAFVGVCNAFLGAVTTVLLYRLARRAAPDWPAVAILGAGLYAVYPHVLLTSTRTLKEPLSVVLLVGFTLAWARVLQTLEGRSRRLVLNCLLMGVLLGLSILSRYLHLGLLVLVLVSHAVLFLLGPRLKVSRPAVALSTALIAALCVLTVSPWLYRNFRVTGEVVLSTHGPMRYLYNSNSALARPETWGYYEAKTVGGAIWEKRAKELASEFDTDIPEKDPDKLLHPAIVKEDDGLREREKKFAKAAILTTGSHPGHVLQLMLGKVINTWRPVWRGSSKLTWLAIGIPHILLMMLALVGGIRSASRFIKEREPVRALPLLLVLFYVVAHTVFYGMIRSRLYAIPFLCFLAVMAYPLRSIRAATEGSKR